MAVRVETSLCKTALACRKSCIVQVQTSSPPNNCTLHAVHTETPPLCVEGTASSVSSKQTPSFSKYTHGCFRVIFPVFFFFHIVNIVKNISETKESCSKCISITMKIIHRFRPEKSVCCWGIFNIKLCTCVQNNITDFDQINLSAAEGVLTYAHVQHSSWPWFSSHPKD